MTNPIRAVYVFGNRSIFLHIALATGQPLCQHRSEAIAKWESCSGEVNCEHCLELFNTPT